MNSKRLQFFRELLQEKIAELSGDQQKTLAATEVAAPVASKWEKRSKTILYFGRDVASEDGFCRHSFLW